MLIHNYNFYHCLGYIYSIIILSLLFLTRIRVEGRGINYRICLYEHIDNFLHKVADMGSYHIKKSSN